MIANGAYSEETAVPLELPASYALGGSERLDEQPYQIARRAAPSVTLRVVDESGRATEVPVDFAEARIEPRGFWGDIAVNGMALFLASVCIILAKELFTWGAAKRKQAKAAAQSSIVKQRRAAISGQLETAEGELRELRALIREGNDEDVADNARRLTRLLDGYRDEIKDYDAPALMAYVDTLIAQLTQILRKRSTMAVPRDNSYDTNLRNPKTMLSPTVDQQETEAAPGPLESTSTEGASSIAGAGRPGAQLPSQEPPDDKTGIAADGSGPLLTQEKPAVVAAPESLPQPVPQESPQPDIDIVKRVMMENPGMNPSEVINLAAQLTMKRKHKQLRRRP